MKLSKCLLILWNIFRCSGINLLTEELWGFIKHVIAFQWFLMTNLLCSKVLATLFTWTHIHTAIRRMNIMKLTISTDEHHESINLKFLNIFAISGELNLIWIQLKVSLVSNIFISGGLRYFSVLNSIKTFLNIVK